MRPKMIVAILLIVLGIVAFAYQGVTYTTQSRGVDIGPIRMTTDKTHHIPLPPVLGAIALIGGITVLFMDRNGPNRAVTR